MNGNYCHPNSVKISVVNSKQCGTNQREQRNEKILQRKRESRKVPRAASCASASLQRDKDFPVASQDRSVKGAVSSQRYGKKVQKKDAKASVGTGEGSKNSTVGNGAWEGNSILLHRTLGKTT